MPSPEFVAVVDETGNSSRPGTEAGDSFGVAALLVPLNLVPVLAATSKQIARIVGANDYKYKHVRSSAAARMEILDAFNQHDSLRLFGLCISGAGLLHEHSRECAAADAYGEPDSQHRRTASFEIANNPRKHLLQNFIEYMAPCFAAYAVGNQLRISVKWDQRSDLDFIRKIWVDRIELQAEHPGYRDASQLVTMDGEATGPLSHLARLAGVVAGDIRQLFTRRGPFIWEHLEPNGIRGETDPIPLMYQNLDAPVSVGVVTEPLIDDDPRGGDAETCMIGGYYDRMMEHAISFCDPEGRMGHIQMRRFDRWEIFQLPD